MKAACVRARAGAHAGVPAFAAAELRAGAPEIRWAVISGVRGRRGLGI